MFLSWSGERSQTLAAALRDWLPLVLHYAEPWLSKTDINAGDRWSLEVAKELDVSGFGVSCITSENISAPWLLFEAGALAKSLQEGRVVPLLLGLDFSDISGPFAQFQAKKTDKSGIWETISAINAVATTPVLGPKLVQLFGALWPSLEAQIAAIPDAPNPAKHSRPQGEVLEELVSSVRNLDARMREDLEEGRSPRRSKRHHARMMVAEEAMHIAMDDPSETSGVMVMASMFREEYPWIYELAREFCDSVKAMRVPDVESAYRRLMSSADIIGRRGSSEGDGRNVHYLMSVVDRAFSAFGDRQANKKAAPTVKMV